jgi:hypothetical protein
MGFRPHGYYTDGKFNRMGIGWIGPIRPTEDPAGLPYKLASRSMGNNWMGNNWMGTTGWEQLDGNNWMGTTGWGTTGWEQLDGEQLDGEQLDGNNWMGIQKSVLDSQ